MESKSLLEKFVEGGFVVPLIGGAAMLARLLSTAAEISIAEQIKRIISAAIASGIMWFVLEQTDLPSLYKAISYGITGAIAPEIIGGIVKLAKKFQKDPEKFIK